MTPLTTACQLLDLGVAPLPLRRGEKRPSLPDWKRYQTELPTRADLDRWFLDSAHVGIFVVCGQVSRLLVLDIDSDAAEAWWRGKLGELLDHTTCVRTAKGHHYWFRLPADLTADSWNRHEGDLQFDVQAEGKGVVAPPSIHESGHVYEWLRGPESLQTAPPELLRPAVPQPPTELSAPSARGLVSLLQVPAAPGGRNLQLAQVAGHYAAAFSQDRGAYEYHVALANAALPVPLDPAELAGVTSSIWRREQGKRPRAAGLEVLTTDQLRSLPPPEFLVDQVLVRDTLAVLFGLPAGGKSFVAIDWAISVATGEVWAGHPVHRGPVLYLAAEGRAGLAQRVEGWEAGHGGVMADGVLWLPRAVNLLDAGDVERLAELVQRERPGLIVVDTLARCLVGGEENSAKDVGRAIDAVDQVRALSGATALLVHHTTKDGQTLRGSSALLAAVDTAVSVRKNGSGVRLKCEKQKDAPAFSELGLRLVPSARSASLSVADVAATLAASPESRRAALTAVVAAFSATPASRVQLRDVIMTTCGVARDTAYRALNDLVVQGFLRREGSLFVVTPVASQSVAGPSQATGRLVARSAPLFRGGDATAANTAADQSRTRSWRQQRPDERTTE